MTLLGCWVMWRDARDLLELKPKAKLRESELVFVEPHLGLFVGETFTQCYLRREQEARSQERNGGRRWRTGGTFELRSGSDPTETNYRASPKAEGRIGIRPTS